jgi:hypothetical protein
MRGMLGAQLTEELAQLTDARVPQAVVVDPPTSAELQCTDHPVGSSSPRWIVYQNSKHAPQEGQAVERFGAGGRPETAEEEEGERFRVAKCRWLVERTSAWPGQDRRLNRDSERRPNSSEAFEPALRQADVVSASKARRRSTLTPGPSPKHTTSRGPAPGGR